MKLKILYRLFLVINVLFFFWSSTPTTQAKTIQSVLTTSMPSSDCTAVDLAFVIDQSKEMARIDPNQVRINAIHWLIDVLGYDRLMQCPDTVHRVTVVSFSGTINTDSSQQVSETSVDLDVTPINPDPTTSNPWGDWAAMHQSIISSISQQKLNERNFQSLYDAIDIAADKLSDAPNIGTGKREKAIILMIGGNGAPCTVNLKCTHYSVSGYQKRLEDLFKTKIQNTITFRALIYGTEIEPGNPFKFPEFWKTISEPYGGELYEIGEPNIDTAKSLMKIYQTLSPRPGLEEICGTTFIDPIVEKAAFSVFSENPQSRIIFQSQTNQQIKNTPQAGVSELIYSTNTGPGPSNYLDYVFKNPIPGLWQFDAACSNKQALVYVQVIHANQMQLVGPKEKIAQFKEQDQIFDPADLHYLQVRVVDSQQKPMPSPSDFAGVGRGEVDVPGQAAYPLTFRYEYENGVYTSNEPLPVNIAGDIPWKADFTFTPANPQGDTEAQVIHFEEKYSVAVRKPFIIKLENPTVSQRFTLHGLPGDHWMKTKPFVVQVRVAPRDNSDSAEGLTLPLTGDLKKAIKVTLINTKTNHYQDLWLEQSKDDPFVFKGQIGDALEEEGDYSVVASFTGTYDIENYRYVNTEASTKIQRFDTILTDPKNWIATAGVISAIILALLLLLLYRITNPVSGYLVFSAPIPNQPPFAIINLRKYGRRKVTLEQQGLLKKSLLLANLETIVVQKNRLFGGKHVITVREHAIPVPITSELEEPQNSQRLPVGDTRKGYKIEYSDTSPDDLHNDVG